MTDDDDELNLPAPAYNDDEGVGMNDDDDDMGMGGSILYGPQPRDPFDGGYENYTGYAQSYDEPGYHWTFNHFDAARQTGSDAGDADGLMNEDNDSNIAANGDDDVDDGFAGQARLVEDFGDDLTGANHPPSPAADEVDDDTPGIVGKAAVHCVTAEMEAGAQAEEEPVAEVHVDADAESSPHK